MLHTGKPLEDAEYGMILIHGRGATADSILSLAEAFDRPQFAYLAPEAKNNTWYPYRFIVPLEQNEPHLSSALQVIADLLAHLGQHGIPPERTILGGFSQGACLVSEFAARNPRRYGGLFAFSGGVIGPEGEPRNDTGSLQGTPVFVGCSDQDFHIPLTRVHETSEVFRKLEADVTERIYPGMGHTVIQDEIDHVVRIMDALTAAV